jgi:acyl-CoA thioesterase-2
VSPPVSSSLQELLGLLDLEQLETDVFRGQSPDDFRQRVFGGQVAGQALVAAGRTVEAERAVHSLHAYFLRPGDPKIPILYLVDRIRDGRSFTTRRVVAVQHGKAIFNLAASFTAGEPGMEHQVTAPTVTPAERLPPLAEALAGHADNPVVEWVATSPIELRYAGAHPLLVERGVEHEASTAVWLRAAGTLPDDPLIHVCVLTYASDITLLDSALLAHGKAWGRGEVLGASLDHAMWFHRPFRADEWLLYDQHSPTATGGRALAEGRIFTEAGDLAVTVVQEGLMRTPR